VQEPIKISYWRLDLTVQLRVSFVSQEKMLPIEEASFTNKKTSWDKFVFNRKTEARVAGYIKSYISKKYP
jgi:hypothetical protein